MTVKITQVNDQPTDRPRIKVEGKLTGDDVAFLERTVAALAQQGGPECVIDLSGVTFVSNDIAAVLNRMARDGAILTGMDFFVRSVIEIQAQGNLTDR